jgi:uncharacterized repeat protein (TIGR02543 family)
MQTLTTATPGRATAHAARTSRRMRRALSVIAQTAVLCTVAASLSATAQTATIYGSLGNFDVVNNTGQDACGFEVELEGVPSNTQVTTFSAQRYGPAAIIPYVNGAVSGLRVRHESRDCSLNKTIAHAPGTGFAGTCYQWNTATYGNAGCEHFGVHYNAQTTKVSARWLVRDPANAGSYIPHDPPMAIAMPYYYIQPPVVANAEPVVVDVVEAPEPPEAPERFGNAQWMRVYVRQMTREVTLDELLTDNPLVVPMDPTLLESDWQLIQADPPADGAGRRNRNRHQGGNTIKPDTRAVVRRYEMYNYAGPVDPVTNEALCADLLCKVPGAGEVGDFISANMTAVNVQGDFINVTKSGTGGGNVDSTDKRISCGSKCASAYPAGTAITLTAKANSGSTFAGWTGACTGTGSCTVTVNGARAVGAVFNAQAPSGGGGGGTTGSVQLKVSASNSGTITSDIGGINCGTVCQANYATGTVVTLTATPPAGKTFAGWSGACTGVAPSCAVTVNGNLSVKANFNK